jgi:hypothetical protein
VRCVPPQNKPLPAEINTCRQFLSATIAAMPKLRAIVPLGRIAHETTLKVLGLRSVAAPFAHGAVHMAGTYKLYDSYHCSRYNTNTGVLTPKMFRSVFAKVRADLDQYHFGVGPRGLPGNRPSVSVPALRDRIISTLAKPGLPSATPARHLHFGPVETPDRTHA